MKNYLGVVLFSVAFLICTALSSKVGAQESATTLDIIGIRLGMSPEEVKKVISAHRPMINGKATQFDVDFEFKHTLVRGAQKRLFQWRFNNFKSALAAHQLSPEEDAQITPIQRERILGIVENRRKQSWENRGERENISLEFADHPNPHGLTKILREQRVKEVHRDTVMQALVKKYGQPTLVNYQGHIFYWVADDKGMLIPNVPFPNPGVNPPCVQEALFRTGTETPGAMCGEILRVNLSVSGSELVVTSINSTLTNPTQEYQFRRATMEEQASVQNNQTEKTRSAPAPAF